MMMIALIWMPQITFGLGETLPICMKNGFNDNDDCDYDDNYCAQVENIGVEGEGKYTCVASNIDGSIEKIVDVEVSLLP